MPFVDGTFFVYADGSDEPFFDFLIEEKILKIYSIDFSDKFRIYDHEDRGKGLVALVDCSKIGAPNCGRFGTNRLYGNNFLL